MTSCWCHAAMAGWLDVPLCAVQAVQPAPQAVKRWQQECERAGGDCGSRVEAIALRLQCARALRSGNTLKIFTQAGQVEFVDLPQPDGLVHRYLGLLEPDTVHLVRRQAPEGARFFTVCHRSGRMAAYEGLPSVVERSAPVPRPAFAVYS